MKMSKVSDVQELESYLILFFTGKLYFIHGIATTCVLFHTLNAWETNNYWHESGRVVCFWNKFF